MRKNQSWKNKYPSKHQKQSAMLLQQKDYAIPSVTLFPDYSIDIENLHEHIVYILTVYGEARGEALEGITAVACVIYNRWRKQTWFGNTIRDVCLRKNGDAENPIYQFSCWNPKDKNYRSMLNIEPVGWFKCVEPTLDVYYYGNDEYPYNMLNYHSIDIKPPYWVKNLRHYKTIGRHEFYIDPSY